MRRVAEATDGHAMAGGHLEVASVSQDAGLARPTGGWRHSSGLHQRIREMQFSPDSAHPVASRPSGCRSVRSPETSPTGACAPGASSASRGTARRTPARRRRRTATAKFRAGTWMVMGSCKNSPCKSSDGSALAWTASLNRPRTRQESPCFPNVGDTQKRTTWLLFTIHRRRCAQMRRDPRWRKRRRGQDTTRTMRTGMRWQVAPNAVFGLEGTQRADSAGEGHNEVRLRAALRF